MNTALGAYLSDPSVPAHEKLRLLEVFGRLHGQVLDVGGRGIAAGNTLTIPPHLQANTGFATNLPIDPSLLRAAQQQQAMRAAKGWRDQQMNNPMLAQARMGEGMTTNADQPLIDPVNILAGAGAGSLLSGGLEGLGSSLLSNTAGEYGLGALTAGAQTLGNLGNDPTTGLGGATTTPLITRINRGQGEGGQLPTGRFYPYQRGHVAFPTEPLKSYEFDPQGVPKAPRYSDYGENWPEFEPNPYYYPHGLGQKATVPMERAEASSRTQPLYAKETPSDFVSELLGDRPLSGVASGTGRLDPGYVHATQPLDDPMLSLHRTMPLDWSNGGWNPNWENHLKASKTNALSADDYSLAQLNALQHPDLPRDLPPDAMFHGFNVWGQGMPDELGRSGLGAGWFSKEPLDFAGPIYAAVSRQQLPPLLSQLHIHPSDPDIEYIPKWRGANIPKGIPPTEDPARQMLHEIGGMGRHGPEPDVMTVHPYHVLLVDQAKNILGRLGRSRAGQKATKLLTDFGEILRQAHEGE
jgi:hypothetical protein